MTTGYGARPGYPRRPTRRRKPYKMIALAVGAVILVCGIALCGLNLSDPTHRKSAGAQDSGTQQQAPPAAGSVAGSGVPESGQPAGTPVAPPPPTNSAVVPNMVGLNAAVAGDQLKRLGFKNIQYASGDKRYKLVILPENWSVTKQSATAGTALAKDSLIVLTCVKP